MPEKNELQQLFCEYMTSGDESLKKRAEYAVNSHVREKMRENGIVRSNLLPALKITPADLDRHEDPVIKRKFVEKEPDTTATWVPFYGMSDSQLIKGQLGEVRFGKIESVEHVCNIADLMTYRYDIRAILNEFDIKEMQKQEDSCFITQINALAAANPATQDIQLYGGLTKTNWASATQQFPIDIPLKYALMNNHTAKEFLKWDYVADFGFGTDGSKAFNSGAPTKVQGINIIGTMKSDLVPFGIVYFFGREDFVGKFYELQEPTTFTKAEKDYIQFQSYEIVGLSVINTRSFIKCTFNDI